MTSNFPFELLRVGPPPASTFTITEIAHRAKLDQNESPVDVPQSVKERILEGVAQQAWCRYPQPKQYAKCYFDYAQIPYFKHTNLFAIW